MRYKVCRFIYFKSPSINSHYSFWLLQGSQGIWKKILISGFICHLNSRFWSLISLSSNDFKLTTKLNRQTLETFSSTMLPQPCHCFQRKIIPIQNSPGYALLFYKIKTGPVIGKKKCQGTHMGKKEKDKKEVILFFPQKEMSLKCLSHRQSTQNVLLLSQ